MVICSHSIEFGLLGLCRGEWILENVEYCKFNHVLISIIAAVPDAGSLLEQINTTLGTYYTAISIYKGYKK